MSAAAIAKKIARTSKAGKTSRPGKKTSKAGKKAAKPSAQCIRLKAQEDSIRRQREALEKRNEEERRKAQSALSERHKKEAAQLAAKHKRESDAVVSRFGCTPKVRHTAEEERAFRAYVATHGAAALTSEQQEWYAQLLAKDRRAARAREGKGSKRKSKARSEPETATLQQIEAQYPATSTARSVAAATSDGWRIGHYNTPLEDAQDDISVTKALEIASEDSGLLRFSRARPRGSKRKSKAKAARSPAHQPQPQSEPTRPRPDLHVGDTGSLLREPQARSEAKNARRAQLGPRVYGYPTAVALQTSRGSPRIVPARFVLVSAAALVPSHDSDTFAPRPDYPAHVQERRYEADRAEQLKVIDIAQNMTPGLLQNTSVGAVDGTPVIAAGERMFVLGGNGRSMGSQRHYRSGRLDLAEFVRDNAAQWGFTRAQVEAVPDPIVVREVDAPRAEWSRWVRDLNVASVPTVLPADYVHDPNPSWRRV